MGDSCTSHTLSQGEGRRGPFGRVTPPRRKTMFCDPTLAGFELCMHFGSLDRLRICLIQFPIGNRKDSHLWFKIGVEMQNF